MTIELKGQIPSGKNQQQIVMVRGRVMKFPNKRFKLWRADAAGQVALQQPGATGIAAPCRMVVKYTPGDRLRRDVSGILDAIFHLLEHVGVVENDYFIQDVDWESLPLDRAAPGAVLTLEPK